MWSARAMHEVRNASRTWFVTLTLRPEEHTRLLYRGLIKKGKRGVDQSMLDPEEVFRVEQSEVALEITKYVKRVRKEAKSPLRFLIVCERHKNGHPHYHALIHERGGPVTYKTLSSQWPLGFGKWKLIEDEKAAFYVVKYLGKSQDARVRASLRYGGAPPSRPLPIESEASVVGELKALYEKSQKRKEIIN